MEKQPLSIKEKCFIQEVIGPQLQNPHRVSVRVNDQPLELACCLLGNGNPFLNFEADVILLLPGFGSGWRGISKLGYDFAKLGYLVCMLSLPGYGNSSDPPAAYYRTEGFDWEALAIKEFLVQAFPGQKVHLVAHSMGAAIGVVLANLAPQQLASLTLLNPAGFEKRNRFELAYKFALNGFQHFLAFRNNATWAELEKFLPKQTSAFTKNRIPQRLSEWRRLCSDNALRTFNIMPNHIPVLYITGGKDIVFPWRKSAIIKQTLQKSCRSCATDILPGLYHNTTMFGSRITAQHVDHFLRYVR